MGRLDDWIAGGHYASWPVVVECLCCGTEFDALRETEYGVENLTPGECPECGAFEDDELVVRDVDEAR